MPDEWIIVHAVHPIGGRDHQEDDGIGLADIVSEHVAGLLCQHLVVMSILGVVRPESRLTDHKQTREVRERRDHEVLVRHHEFRHELLCTKAVQLLLPFNDGPGSREVLW